MEVSDLIDSFLRGEMTEEQERDMLSTLGADPLFRQKLALRKIVIEGISLAHEEKLKEDLKALDRSSSGKHSFKFDWRIAAVLIIVVLSGGIFYLQNSERTPRDFDVADPGLPNVMGLSKNLEFARAMNSFKADDMESAGASFEKLLSLDPVNDTLLYYTAICDFRLNQNQQAIDRWLQVDDKSVFLEKANFRMAIAYWEIGDLHSARELLLQVSNNRNHPYRKEALKALESFD